MTLPKHIYIIVIGLLSFDYIPPMMGINSVHILMLSLLWCIVGLVIYNKQPINSLNNRKNQRVPLWILILTLISCISPVFQFGQTFLQGLMQVLPLCVLVLYLNVFIKMQPNEDDFYKAFKVLGVLAGILMVFAIMNPLLYLDEERLDRRMLSDTTDVFFAAPGFQALVYLFFFATNKLLKHKPKILDVCLFAFSLAFIFIFQNRSTLLVVIPLASYLLLTSRFKYRKLIIAFAVLGIGYYGVDIIEALIEQSTEELNNSDYNRWKAIAFFTTDWNYNPLTFLFGNGSPRGETAFGELILKATSDGVYMSDVGMIGSFFCFGAILMSILYSFIFKGLKSYNPIYLRFYAGWILFVPTIHIFSSQALTHSFKLIIFIYLVIYYHSLNKSQNKLSKQYK